MSTRRAPAGTPARHLQDALRSTDPVEVIDAVARLRERLDQAEQAAVVQLRQRGASWQDVADATGMASRQAAQYRYEHAARLDAVRAER